MSRQGEGKLDRLPTSRGCIVCGRDNPIGLHVQFTRAEAGVQAVVRPGPQFEGFEGVLQGGIVAGLMDDAMWFAIYGSASAVTMTAELSVRFKRPVPVDAELLVTAAVAEKRRSLYTCKAAIAAPDGTILAEAEGKFLTAPAELAARLQATLT